MGLQAQQIIALALQDAKVPGFTAQAGQLLNAILSEICETYDFQATKATVTGVLNPSLASTNPNLIQGNGPYALPAATTGFYLRMVRDDFVYYVSGLPYPMVPWDEYEFDAQPQQVGIASLPRSYYTDLSNPAAPAFFVYPPPNAAYPYQLKCHIRMPDIGTNVTALTGWASGNSPPEMSTVVPWFPNTTYLRQRVAGELMKITGDRRWQAFLGKNRDGTGAQDILERLLAMKDDTTNRAQRITLDRRRFGSPYRNLADTKNIFG